MKDPNEDRKGYKQTKVGWIPKAWECVQLTSVAKLESGHTPSRKHPEYWNGSIPWVSLQDVGRLNGKEILTTAHYVTAEGIKRSSARLLPKGTVIFSRTATVGKVTTLGVEMATSQDFANYVCGPRLQNHFLVQLFRSMSSYWRRKMAGSTHNTVYMPVFSSLSIPLPSFEEQRRIVDVLQMADDEIEKTRALIKAKQRQKKALMQQLLTGKKRLPKFGSKRRARVKFRYFDLPGDWGCPHMGEIAAERIERNGSGGHVILTCSKHRGFVESRTYFKKQVFSEDTTNYKVVRKGWFGFPSNHVEEGSIGLLKSHSSGAVSPIYTVFETAGNIHPEFLYAVLKTETFRHIFAATTNASVDRRGSLRWDAFAGIRVPCPPLAEQIAISRVLSDADLELKSLEAKRAALEQQKRVLMQKLLTGEVRVKV